MCEGLNLSRDVFRNSHWSCYARQLAIYSHQPPIRSHNSQLNLATCTTNSEASGNLLNSRAERNFLFASESRADRKNWANELREQQLLRRFAIFKSSSSSMFLLLLLSRFFAVIWGWLRSSFRCFSIHKIAQTFHPISRHLISSNSEPKCKQVDDAIKTIKIISRETTRGDQSTNLHVPALNCNLTFTPGIPIVHSLIRLIANFGKK